MKKILLVLLMALLLTGCGKESEFSGNTQLLNIPISDTQVCTFGIPIELGISQTDNNVYWKLTDGTEIRRLTVTTPGTSVPSKTFNDVYITDKSVLRTFDGCSVMITTSKQNVDVFETNLGSGSICDINMTLEKKKELEYLDAYADVEMELNDNNLLMPKDSIDCKIGTYMGAVFMENGSYIESFIKDGVADDILLCVNCLAKSNGEEVVHWYKSNDKMYIETDNQIAAAIKLTYNQWYIYTATVDYKDHILYGMEHIHFSGE